METTISITPIGKVLKENGMFIIELEKEYLPALEGMEGFSHLQIVWWGHLLDKPENRKVLTTNKPYKTGPEVLGIFATHSPVRPNPLLITTIAVAGFDKSKGRISTWYIDAEPGTPVLDIKPYHKNERIRDCRVPDWCSHWPEWYEDSATFDWQKEFNF